MKKIIIAMAAVAAAFTMASCNKEPLAEPEVTPVAGNDVITAFTENTLTKTALKQNEAGDYDVVWSDGDQFKIGGNLFTLIEGANTTTGKFQGNLPEGDGPFTAYYPATYNGIDWPALQTYAEGNITGSPMIAEEVVKGAESLSFKNAGGILRLTVKGTATIKTIKVSATDLNEITLDCGDGVKLDNTNGTVFHIAMPEGEYSGVSIYFEATDDNYCIKKTLKKETKLKIIKSQITPASLTTNFTFSESTDHLSSAFSIADGKQICFSKGNLYYDGSFKFESKQYEFHGYDSGSKTWGLFGWSTSATKYGMSKSETNIDYSGDFVDWGKAIDSDITWRTLTMEEWEYLFEKRANAADKYGYATVGGVYGIIILPDLFTDPMKNGGNGAFAPKTTTGWNANVYTTGGNWGAMEDAGAVFLPAAGSRSGSSLSYVGDYGFYWSSSYDANSGPYGLTFYSSLVDPDASGNVTTGKSVRLVADLHTVTFDMNGKIGTAPESLKEIPHGSRITWPSGPTADGYTFKGWYKNMACTDKWNFETDEVTANTTLYAKWIEGALPGKFTINSDGKQVYFSAGNLTYTNNKWAFYANQTDYAGDKYWDSLVSQFTWGYGTWSTDAETGAYIEGPDFVDWGIKIGDGKTWYTLSLEEWSYLVGTRTVKGNTGYGNTCVMATIDGVYGLVIFYDGYEGENTDLKAIPNGCAFLPAAGVRYVTYHYINRAGSQGEYWSRSSCTNLYAYGFLFDKTGFWTSNNNDKRQARSVRLVTDVVEQ